MLDKIKMGIYVRILYHVKGCSDYRESLVSFRGSIKVQSEEDVTKDANRERKRKRNVYKDLG